MKQYHLPSFRKCLVGVGYRLYKHSNPLRISLPAITNEPSHISLAKFPSGLAKYKKIDLDSSY